MGERSDDRWRRLAKRLRAVLAALGIGLAASSVVALLWASGFLGGTLKERFGGFVAAAEGLVMDYHVRWRGARRPHPDIAIVAVDAASIDHYGRWPWPRSCIASLIGKIDAAGASVIALDVIFSEPDEEDAALVAALDQAGEKVVLGFFTRDDVEVAGCAEGESSCASEEPGEDDPFIPDILPDDGSTEVASEIKTARFVETNLDRFEEVVDYRQGFFSHEREQGVQRKYDLVTRIDDQGDFFYYPALALRAASHYLGREATIEIGAGGLPKLLLGDDEVATDSTLRMPVNYAGANGHYPTHRACDVLAREPQDLASELSGKLVFLGVTETGVGDVVATPFGEMVGVEVHANVAGNLLAHDYLRDGEWQKLWSLVAVFALGLIVALLVSSIGRNWLGAVAALAAVLAWFAVCHWAFVEHSVHLWAVPPILAGVLSLVLTLPYQLFVVEGRSRRVRNLFHHYLAPAIIDQLLEQDAIELGSVQEKLTVLFSDIRGFTDLSEGKSPQEVVEVLNEFFTPMTRIVLDAGGTLDKYMGDAMMAFFGAPVKQSDHAARACRAALAMREALAEINERWRAEGRVGEGRPGLGIGIGVNSGEMTVGNMGSEEVFDYTVIGDAVNLGSRLESLNKVYGTEALVSKATKQAAGDGFLFRELDRVRVKGKTEAVAVFELMAAADSAPQGASRLAERFAAALALYRGRHFAEAEAAFAGLAAEGDGPAELFVERCRRYRAEPPPEGWDGVETFTSK